ncbi:AAA family ATPase [Sodalis ligni]|uniref:AAA family ATPase n=1 Tax=Sodalis ligni TaxID=2697027 RepID=UPI001BDE79BF|nr:AAA family ATPase [Sodalis ligni]QWA10856.1 AAA family ATPase [Sodalis ligni]
MGILKLKGVKSYSSEKDIEFDFSKAVTLIYGQNGSGKSTISGYFYRPEDIDYKDCRFEADADLKFIVFNQDYIDATFNNKTLQPGIFTLSQDNGKIQDEINNNKDKIKEYGNEIKKLNENVEDNQEMQNVSSMIVRRKCLTALLH